MILSYLRIAKGNRGLSLRFGVSKRFRSKMNQNPPRVNRSPIEWLRTRPTCVPSPLQQEQKSTNVE